jgi:hypothetical protein
MFHRKQGVQQRKFHWREFQPRRLELAFVEGVRMVASKALGAQWSIANITDEHASRQRLLNKPRTEFQCFNDWLIQERMKPNEFRPALQRWCFVGQLQSTYICNKIKGSTETEETVTNTSMVNARPFAKEPLSSQHEWH